MDLNIVVSGNTANKSNNGSKKKNKYQKKQEKKRNKKSSKAAVAPPLVKQPSANTTTKPTSSSTTSTSPSSSPLSQKQVAPIQKKEILNTTSNTPLAKVPSFETSTEVSFTSTAVSCSSSTTLNKKTTTTDVKKISPAKKEMTRKEKPKQHTAPLLMPSVPFKPISSTEFSRKNPNKAAVESTFKLRDPKPSCRAKSHQELKTSNHMFESSTKSSTFESLGITSTTLLKKLVASSYLTPTIVQSRAIPTILSSKKQDVLIKSETGSGKTLAFALPIYQNFIASSSYNNASRAANGTKVLVLSPTRELCQQIVSTFNNIHCSHFGKIVIGSVTGGEKKKSEKSRIRKGVTILVGTPGRLLDHLKTTACFKIDLISSVVLDEADMLLELGFESQVTQIMSYVKKATKKNQRYQTILVSATINQNVKRLSKVATCEDASVENDAILIDATTTNTTNSDTDNIQMMTVPKQLVQHHVIVPIKLRASSLACFLLSKVVLEKRNNAKILVFLSTCDSVDYHYNLFTNLGLFSEGTTRMFKLHGNIDQSDRVSTYNAIRQQQQQGGSGEKTIIFSTDVAARGLNLDGITWIVQYDAPSDIRDYVHRVGRTCRVGASGQSVLFVSPAEETAGYIQYVERCTNTSLSQLSLESDVVMPAKACVNITKRRYSIAESVLSEIQFQIEQYIIGSSSATSVAGCAFHSYIRSYATHSNSSKSYFHVRSLHFGHVAKSFGLREAPSSKKLTSEGGSLTKRKLLQEKENYVKTKKSRVSKAKIRSVHSTVSEFAE